MKPENIKWSGDGYMRSAHFSDGANTYSVVDFTTGDFMVNEECEDKEGELIHRTYFVNDALQWGCFLSDKEQVHGQDGIGEQAAHGGVPRERGAAGTGQS